MRAVINLERLANECNIEIVTTDDPDWGGKYGYHEKGSNCTFLGFKTKRSALKSWFESALDGNLGKVLLRDYLTVK